MPVYNTPDVYVEEISTLPPSIAEVSTAIPAFIGYTGTDDRKLQPTRITSFLEFTSKFKSPAPVNVTVMTDSNGEITTTVKDDANKTHKLYYLLDLYFKNGGSDCYIVSLGAYTQKNKADFLAGLNELKKEDEPTLIVLSEATTLGSTDYYEVCQEALAQCAALQDRFCIFDILPASSDGISEFRNGIGMTNLSYGAAYFPFLMTSINYVINEKNVFINPSVTPKIISKSGLDISSLKPVTNDQKPGVAITVADSNSNISFALDTGILKISVPKSTKAKDIAESWKTADDNIKANFTIAVKEKDKVVETLESTSFDATDTTSLDSIKQLQPTFYNNIRQALGKLRLVLPASAAVAGVYCMTDRTRGVWKAPANVSLNAVIGPTIKISSNAQENMNVDKSGGGKSINAIRSFTGKGTLIWGARTLDSSNPEWRYIPVRRLFLMIEESAKKASAFAVFEPNDASTWLKVKGMIESFLYGLWQQGALAGATTKSAYYVNIGLNNTMTAQDILDGKMIVEIGIAAVRPAEFIILRFSHKLQES